MLSISTPNAWYYWVPCWCATIKKLQRRELPTKTNRLRVSIFSECLDFMLLTVRRNVRRASGDPLGFYGLPFILHLYRYCRTFVRIQGWCQILFVKSRLLQVLLHRSAELDVFSLSDVGCIVEVLRKQTAPKQRISYMYMCMWGCWSCSCLRESTVSAGRACPGCESEWLRGFGTCRKWLRRFGKCRKWRRRIRNMP